MSAATCAARRDGLRVPEPGEVVAGKYLVERVLGSGGMGVVLLAQHTLLRHRVAIKFVTPAAASDEVLARFVREARAVAALESEHVVRVFDFGAAESGAPPYMVMQLLVGHDLGTEARARGGRLPISEVADYAIQACAGLAEAHAHGIVHRDVKLGNLFLTRRPNGEPLVKILDFGISKPMREDDAEPTVTSSASFLGSPAYASPEQVRQATGVDHRADVWSLGVVIHRLVCGAMPFAGESGCAVLAAIVADPPTPLRASVPDAPADLEAVVLRCLQKTAAFRYPGVVDLARALAPFASRSGRLCLERIEGDATPIAQQQVTSWRRAAPPRRPSRGAGSGQYRRRSA
jgi:serine/threonine-protein kinase